MHPTVTCWRVQDPDGFMVVVDARYPYMEMYDEAAAVVYRRPPHVASSAHVR